MSYEAEVGKRLRNIRESKELTRREVEEKTNREFKESILAMYENGKRRLPTTRLKKLADFYQVPTSFLLGETPKHAVGKSNDIEAMLMSDPKYSDDEKELLLHIINVIKAKRRAEGRN